MALSSLSSLISPHGRSPHLTRFVSFILSLQRPSQSRTTTTTPALPSSSLSTAISAGRRTQTDSPGFPVVVTLYCRNAKLSKPPATVTSRPGQRRSEEKGKGVKGPKLLQAGNEEKKECLKTRVLFAYVSPLFMSLLHSTVFYSAIVISS